jgi:putrescine transport system permease protein
MSSMSSMSSKPAMATHHSARPARKAPLNLGRLGVIAVPYAWLVVFFLVPFFIILKISISESDGIHFQDLIQTVDGALSIKAKWSNYTFMLSDALYAKAYWNSIQYAFITTVLCLLIGYPFAYFMARSPEHARPVLLMAVMLPFWTSFLLRIYAWKGILANNGLVNNALLGMGWLHEPLRMMNTPISLTIGMVYAYLPFMVLPLYAHLVKMDVRLLEASADLGAKPWETFRLITIPLSKAGIIAGAMLVFIPCVGEYVIPELLGGPETLMIARVLWDEFFSNNDWAMASAVAVTMIVLILVPLAVFNHYQAQSADQQRGRT